MNCSRRLPIRCWLACLLASLFFALGSAQDGEARGDQEARPATVDKLFTLLSKVEGLEARFVEEKHLALLAVPLKSEGTLYVLRPGYLARIVQSPAPSRLTITPDELRMQDQSGKTEILRLDKNESVRVFVTSIMRVLLGDKRGLERAYEIRYRLDEEDKLAWDLELTPRKKLLNEMLEVLVLSGRGSSISEIRVVEPNGDKTITRIEKANPKRRFSNDEKRELFGLQAER